MRVRNALVLFAVVAMAGCADSGGVSLNTDLVPETPDESGELAPVADVLETAGTDERPEADIAIPDGAVCVPGHTQCVGTNFLTCKSDGSDWLFVKCDTGTVCTATGCAESMCPANEAKCDADGKVVVCLPNGSGYGAPVACDADQVCKGGQCLAKACTEGDTKCTQTSVIACKNGAWVENACTANQVCFQGECIDCFTDSQCTAGTNCVSGHCVRPSLKVKTTELPDGQVETAYTAQLEAIGGDGTYTWSSGALPAGLAIDATGKITGTPTATGTTTTTYTVKDGGGMQASADLPIIIHGKGLTITSKSPLPSGEDGTDYSYQFTAIGGVEPYGWMVLSGALPAGLSLGSDGKLAGTPNDHGTFTFTVRVVDAGDPLQQAKGDFQLTLKIAPLQITGDQVTNLYISKAVILPLLTIVQGIPIPYSQQLQAKGGLKPYTWQEIAMPSLVTMFIPKAGVPTGLTLSSSGLLSGSVTNTDAVVSVKIPFVNYTLTGFFFMGQVSDVQSPAATDSAIFLIPTVPVDLGSLGGGGLP